MAHNNHIVSPFFLIALILFATANPLAHAQISGLSVSGNLCCTSTGTCPGAPVSGAIVRLSCDTALFGGSADVLGQNMTDVKGHFNITVSNVLGLVNTIGLLPCNVVVQLPLNQTAVCPVLSTANGVLMATVQSVGTLLTQALGLVQNANVSAFMRLSV